VKIPGAIGKVTIEVQAPLDAEFYGSLINSPKRMDGSLAKWKKLVGNLIYVGVLYGTKETW